LADCARFGPDLAVQAIQQAVANGWQGLVWQRLTKSPATAKAERHNRQGGDPARKHSGSCNLPDRYAAPVGTAAGSSFTRQYQPVQA
jgi:hypothetical protein